MKRIYITFSGARYHKTTEAIVKYAPLLGADEVKVYDDRWLIDNHPEFIRQHSDLFFEDGRYKSGEKCYVPECKCEKHHDGESIKYTRGFGWFCWKPYIILDALKRFADNGDVILFTDADTYPLSDLKPFFDHADEFGTMLFAANGFSQRHWCKRECNRVMAMDTDEYRDKQAGNARYMLFKKGAAIGNGDNRISTELFLKDWLSYATNKRATTFEKCKDEYPDLQQHRCEQAILTNLAHYYEIPLHCPPCEDMDYRR